jgi:glutamine amidotransferase
MRLLNGKKMQDIWIVDYGVGNVGSLASALKKIDLTPRLATNRLQINSAANIILPGVGASKPAMVNLNKLFGQEIFNTLIEKEKKILGICLGMQLFTEKSFENEITECLGLIRGQVIKLPYSKEMKIPRIGWFPIEKNEIGSRKELLNFESFNNKQFYFAHSYYVDITDKKICTFTSSNLLIPAIIQIKNLIGVQFHPEKSGSTGLKFLQKIFQ